MSSLERGALMAGPLAVYLYFLAVCQSGRTPRVLSGRLDLTMLIFGLSGVVILGPIGMSLLASVTSPAPRLILFGLLGIALTIPLRRSRRRLVVYNVDLTTLETAIAQVLDDLTGSFVRTLRGFEDTRGGQAVRFHISRRMRAAQVEAEGPLAETLIARLQPRLAQALKTRGGGPSAVAWVLLAISCLVMLAPVVAWLANQPAARRALRALMERF